MSYQLNGTTQYFKATTGTPISNTRPFSVIAWVNMDTAAANGCYACSISTSLTGMYSASVDPLYDCTVAGGRHNGGSESNVSGGTMSKDDTWFMAHARWPGSSGAAKAGWDGANEGTGVNMTETPEATLAEFYIGKQKTSSGVDEGWFGGYIAMIAIYNIDLSSTQLSELNTTVPSAHSSTYSSCVAFYDFRTNDANILKNQKNPGTYDLTAYNTPTYSSNNPTLTTKKLKLLAHSSAASASSIAGVVFSAPTGTDITGTTRYGEFTGKSFESQLDASGRAVLKVPVADFGGTALTTASTPVALVRNTLNTTGIVSCTVIEE